MNDEHDKSSSALTGASLASKPRLCPQCRKASASEESGVRPFCSKRCKSLDLGAWASGAYVISAPLSLDDIDEALETDEGFSGNDATDEW
ncbi:MAG: DNA gyrase inhibitor YacG [bacterium]|nr:DNA gyrase inhibitor YacG [bacterium]